MLFLLDSLKQNRSWKFTTNSPLTMLQSNVLGGTRLARHTHKCKGLPQTRLTDKTHTHITHMTKWGIPWGLHMAHAIKTHVTSLSEEYCWSKLVTHPSLCNNCKGRANNNTWQYCIYIHNAFVNLTNCAICNPQGRPHFWKMGMPSKTTYNSL